LSARALLAALALGLLVAAPALAGLVAVAPGFYWLEEDTRHEVTEVIELGNSTWVFHAYTAELPSDYGVEECTGIYGTQPWDLFIVQVFPDDFPFAHEDDDPGAPLRPEFQPGGVLGEKKLGVLVMRMGSWYYCGGWFEGGEAWLNTTITLPGGAGQATVTIVAAQVGGVSPVAGVQYDSNLVIVVSDADTGEILYSETVTLGGDLEGWRTINFTVPATDRITLSLSPQAAGWVPVCETCTGYWDRELIGIDKVTVEAGGAIVFYEDFTLSQAPTPTTPAGEQTEATTREPGETTATQATGAQPPIPVKDGDKLVYKVKLEGEGPEGKASGTGTLTLRAVVVDAETLALQVEENTLPLDAAGLAVAFSTFTDLSNLIVGSTAYYRLPDLKPTLDYECPIFEPGADGTRTGTHMVLGVMKIDYTCTYSQGVLASLQATFNAESMGAQGYVSLEATLTDTTIEGVATAGGGGLNLTLAAAAAAAIAVIAIVVVLKARR